MRVADRMCKLTIPFRSRILLAFSLLCAIGLVAGSSLSAQPGGRTSTSSLEQARDLQQAIDRTLESPEYTWRTEEEAAPWMIRILESLEKMSGAIERWIDAIVEWLTERFGDRSQDLSLAEPSGYSIPAIAIAIALLSGLLAFLYWRQTRRTEPVDVESDRISPLEAIRFEESEAASVESDRWLAWSREFEQDGRYRDAIRALYLATLSHLSERGRLRLARHKSNRDYRRELARREGRDAPVLAAFTGCLSIFERTWYGRHSADPLLLETMRTGTEEVLQFAPERVGSAMPPKLPPTDFSRLSEAGAE